MRLPFHFGEIHVVLGALGEQPRHVHRRARQFGLSVQVLGDLGETPGTEHSQALDHACFGQVLAR